MPLKVVTARGVRVAAAGHLAVTETGQEAVAAVAGIVEAARLRRPNFVGAAREPVAQVVGDPGRPLPPPRGGPAAVRVRVGEVPACLEAPRSVARRLVRLEVVERLLGGAAVAGILAT